MHQSKSSFRQSLPRQHTQKGTGAFIRLLDHCYPSTLYVLHHLSSQMFHFVVLYMYRPHTQKLKLHLHDKGMRHDIMFFTYFGYLNHTPATWGGCSGCYFFKKSSSHKFDLTRNSFECIWTQAIKHYAWCFELWVSHKCHLCGQQCPVGGQRECFTLHHGLHIFPCGVMQLH